MLMTFVCDRRCISTVTASEDGVPLAKPTCVIVL